MSMKNGWLRYAVWVLVATVWTTLCFIVPDYVDNPIDGWYTLAIVTGHITACGIGAFFLLYLIGCNRYVSAVLLPIWGILGSALAFYRIGYHITLTPMLVGAVWHTNAEEASGVLSWQLIGWVILNLLVAVGLVYWRWKQARLPHAWAHCLVALALGAVYVNFNQSLRKIVLFQRFPYNIAYNISRYVEGLRNIEKQRSTPAFTVVNQPDSLTVVFVLGEATRADHLQLNGYERETTPLLSARKNLISYPYIYSEQTFTETCIPYLVTRADSAQEDLQYRETSFFPLFREAGFQTAWLSNQDVETSFSHFLSESDTVVFANAGKSVYVYSQWLDGELLPLIDSVFSPHPARSLYVLHTIGSHWYYNNHAPEEMHRFQPVTTSRVVAQNSVEQLVNAYDNTILYMDCFVDSLIEKLEDKPAILIFQSDHGEALGEDGLYLHGHSIPGVQNPACFVWYSDQYAALYPEKIQALASNKDKRYRTDYVFYSLLYAAGIEAEGDNETMNIFK